MNGTDVMLTLMTGAIGAMASALAYIYKQTSAKLTDCEQDREELWKVVAGLGGVKPTGSTEK